MSMAAFASTPLAAAPSPSPWAALDEPAEWQSFSRPLIHDGDMQESYLSVEGMHCAACTLAVEAALLRVDGVRSAQVNGATATARIEWSPRVTTPSR
ncbi:MAG: cation transporter, partial [Ramlibacter sp.]|nr:cation transporter [Ramlibacter sp.]